MKPTSRGYSRVPVFAAHIAPLLEPLLFAPAFIAVGWSLMKARRATSPDHKEHR